MRAKFFLLFLTVFCLSLSAPAQSGPGELFDTVFHDFGVLEKGGTYKYDFEYANGGEQPLVITGIDVPCTCTRVKWSKKPLGKGEKGVLTVIYAARDIGVFRKDITVRVNNLPGPAILTIGGRVEKRR